MGRHRPQALTALRPPSTGPGRPGSGALSFLRLRSGRPGPLPSPEEAAAYPYNDLERAFVEDRQATQILGAPETVRQGLAGLLKATAADELMLTTMVYDPADRLRSFELVAALARIPVRVSGRR